MGLVKIIKSLSTVLSSAANKYRQQQEKNSWERQESNLGLLPLCYAATLTDTHFFVELNRFFQSDIVWPQSQLLTEGVITIFCKACHQVQSSRYHHILLSSPWLRRRHGSPGICIVECRPRHLSYKMDKLEKPPTAEKWKIEME